MFLRCSNPVATWGHSPSLTPPLGFRWGSGVSCADYWDQGLGFSLSDSQEAEAGGAGVTKAQRGQARVTQQAEGRWLWAGMSSVPHQPLSSLSLISALPTCAT